MKQSSLFSRTNSELHIALKVSVTTIVINLVLSLFKFFAGIMGKSGAMISDAVHSASDVLSTIIVIIGVRLAGKDSDKEHPYGHDRIECVASILLAGILLATGVSIGFIGINKIIIKSNAIIPIPKTIALIAAIFSIVTKEWMYWYTRASAKKINSSALMADAWHHRSDSLSSIGALIGIGAAQIGYPIFDPIASIVISLFIMKAAYDIFKDSFNKMIDKSCDNVTEDSLKQLILSQEGVLGIDNIKTRLFGSKMYIDVEISADGYKTLFETHIIAHKVHDAIEREFNQVKHCMVHVNPHEPTNSTHN